MTDNRTTELLSVGDILWNEPCDERIVVIAANERNVWLRKVQKNDELAMCDGHVWAMLGKKCNVKNMCTQSYAQSVFELDGHVEQAIAATLGSDDDYEAKMDALLCRLTNGKWSKSRAYDLDFMEQCINEEFEMLYAKELADAELGNGTLKAEQVREAIMSADRWKKPMGNTGLTNTHLIIRDDGWQAIADELNAELGSGTCHIIASSTDGLCSDNPRQLFKLSCGHSFMLYGLGVPVACPVCGAKVVGI